MATTDRKLFCSKTSNFALRTKLHTGKTILEGFRQNTDPRSTDPLLTPYWPPLLTPYKINGKMKIKKSPELLMWPDSSSSINSAYLKLARWRTRCRFRLLFSFYCLVEVLLTENQAQNKIEYHQIVLSCALGNEAKRNADKWTGSRKDRDGLLVPPTRVYKTTSGRGIS